MTATPTNAVIDISHYNTQVDFAQAKAGGIMGVIQKATQGAAYVDPTYATRRPEAEAAGLLWGAYHFGTGDDVTTQVENFLATVGPDNGSMLLVLDFEENTGGSSMTLDQARDFVSAVQARTGRWPGFYSSNSYVSSMLDGPDSVLSHCWFWLARYDSTPEVPSAWPTWTLWQYTDGSAGEEPYDCPGVGPCDRDQYNGDATQLTQFWEAGGVASVSSFPPGPARAGRRSAPGPCRS